MAARWLRNGCRGRHCASWLPWLPLASSLLHWLEMAATGQHSDPLGPSLGDKGSAAVQALQAYYLQSTLILQ